MLKHHLSFMMKIIILGGGVRRGKGAVGALVFSHRRSSDHLQWLLCLLNLQKAELDLCNLDIY